MRLTTSIPFLLLALTPLGLAQSQQSQQSGLTAVITQLPSCAVWQKPHTSSEPLLTLTLSCHVSQRPLPRLRVN